MFLSAARRALPKAQVAVDLFHVVQLALKAVGDVRRRATREKYGRRGKEGDPEYGIKGLLQRKLESLRPDQFAKVIETLDADGHGQQIAIAWIAKEKLRAVLNLRARFRRSQPRERQVRALCVPITSSTLCDQPIFVDHAADVGLSSHAVLVEVDRLG